MIVKNKLFYWVFIIFLLSLSIYNVLLFLKTYNVIALISMGLQSMLLLFLFLKHRYAKPFIKIWLIVFVVAASVFQMIMQLIPDFHPDKVLEDFFIINLVYFAVGLFFLTWIDKAFKIPRHETRKANQRENL